jgi:hypothetical protein
MWPLAAAGIVLLCGTLWRRLRARLRARAPAGPPPPPPARRPPLPDDLLVHIARLAVHGASGGQPALLDKRTARTVAALRQACRASRSAVDALVLGPAPTRPRLLLEAGIVRLLTSAPEAPDMHMHVRCTRGAASMRTESARFVWHCMRLWGQPGADGGLQVSIVVLGAPDDCAAWMHASRAAERVAALAGLPALCAQAAVHLQVYDAATFDALFSSGTH